MGPFRIYHIHSVSHPQRTLKQDPQRVKRAQIPRTGHRWNPSMHQKKKKKTKVIMEIHCFSAIQPWSSAKLGWCPPFPKGRLSWHLSAGGLGNGGDTDTSVLRAPFWMPHSSSLLTCGLSGSLLYARHFRFCTGDPSLNTAPLIVTVHPLGGWGVGNYSTFDTPPAAQE